MKLGRMAWINQHMFITQAKKHRRGTLLCEFVFLSIRNIIVYDRCWNLFSIGSGYHEDNPVMSWINILCFFSYKWMHILIKREKKCVSVCICVYNCLVADSWLEIHNRKNKQCCQGAPISDRSYQMCSKFSLNSSLLLFSHGCRKGTTNTIL